MMERVQDEAITRAQKPCCDKDGWEKDEIKFLEYIEPEFMRLAREFPNREVAKRFAISLDRERPYLPPGKVFVQMHRPKVMDKRYLSHFGCFCCFYDPWTGECHYCCWGHEGEKKTALLAAGAAALVVYAAWRLFAGKE
jgi:hypothetical protein